MKNLTPAIPVVGTVRFMKSKLIQHKIDRHIWNIDSFDQIDPGLKKSSHNQISLPDRFFFSPIHIIQFS